MFLTQLHQSAQVTRYGQARQAVVQRVEGHAAGDAVQQLLHVAQGELVQGVSQVLSRGVFGGGGVEQLQGGARVATLFQQEHETIHLLLSAGLA